MTGRRIGGILACVIGIIWILQGLDIRKGDGMSGHDIWAFLGAILVVLGAALLRGAGRSTD